MDVKRVVIGFFSIILMLALLSCASNSVDKTLFLNFPKEALMGGYVSSAGTEITFHSAVEKNAANNHVYWYKIANVGGDKEVIVQWELIDRAISGKFNFMHLIRLKPGEIKMFKLETDLPPEIFNGEARIFTESGMDIFDFFKREGVFVSTKEGMWHMFGTSFTGHLPKG